MAMTTKPNRHDAEVDASDVRAHRDAVLAAQQTEADYPLGAKGRTYQRDLTTLAQAAVISSDDVPGLLNTIADLRRELAVVSERGAESASREQDASPEIPPTNPHAVEIVRDEAWPTDADVAAYSWQCECGESGDPKYAADLYGQEVDIGAADRRARSFAEIDALDHTESHVEIVNDEIERGENEWELSL
jgi:hypothetical protein